jgi:zinc transport system substrate-binding protein
VPAIDAGAVAGLEPISHDGHDDAGHDSPGAAEPSDLGDLNPHFWQDPLKLAKVADAVAAALAKVDPGHADDYRANAAALDGDLTRLDQEYAAGLQGCARDTVVVSHNAFGYLGRYGLYIEPISGLSPDAEPTPADLARLHQLIEEDGITTVFGERLVSPKLAQSLADDMGVTAAVLDPIEGLSSETSSDDYLSLMRDNLAALRKADGCP